VTISGLKQILNSGNLVPSLVFGLPGFAERFV